MDMYPMAVPLNAHASIVQVHMYITVNPYLDAESTNWSNCIVGS